MGKKKKSKTSVKQTENELEINVVEVGVKSLPELIKRAKVNQKIWKVDSHIINNWPVTMRSPSGGMQSAIQWQTKARFVRKTPIPIMPVIQPIRIGPKAIRKANPTIVQKDLKTAVVLPDPQFGFWKDPFTGEMTPFHDRSALSVALKLVEDISPDVVIWNGDFLDLPMMGKYLKRPEFYFTLQHSIIEGAWWLRQFVKAGKGVKTYLMKGNHDIRLETAIMERNIAAYNLKAADELNLPPAHSVPKLLALHQMGIEYIEDYPDGRIWLNKKLAVEHGATARSKSGETVNALANKRQYFFAMGHIHRRELVSRTIWEGGKRFEISGMSPGCLCGVNGEVPGRQKQNNWQQGIGLIYYTDDFCEMKIIEIRDGRALWGGGMFRSENTKKIVKQIKADCGIEQI